MALRFTIRSADLKRLRKSLDADRCPTKDKQWTVYLEVTPSIAEFRFHDKHFQYPIDGKSTGFARFPQHVIWNATRWFLEKKPPAELEISIYIGGLRCHDSLCEHEIDIGYIRHPKTREIFYMNHAELVALGQMLEDPSSLNPELPLRIKEAEEGVAWAVSDAASTLRRCSVTYEEVKGFVDARIAELKPTIRARFDFVETKLWKS